MMRPCRCCAAGTSRLRSSAWRARWSAHQGCCTGTPTAPAPAPPLRLHRHPHCTGTGAPTHRHRCPHCTGTPTAISAIQPSPHSLKPSCCSTDSGAGLFMKTPVCQHTKISHCLQNAVLHTTFSGRTRPASTHATQENFNFGG